ncbi:hypothetical protein MMC14_000274 [Varicellaria rhodocarpa]|nr:hypothetical protein [Varicellaria rhodocarpa]
MKSKSALYMNVSEEHMRATWAPAGMGNGRGTKANNYTESSTARSESTGDGNVTRRFLWDFVMQQGDVGEPVSIIQRWKLSVGKQAESPSATVVVDINPTGGSEAEAEFESYGSSALFLYEVDGNIDIRQARTTTTGTG